MDRSAPARFRGPSDASSARILSSSRSTKARRIHNCADMSTRGEHLVRADRGFATGGGLVARFTMPAISKVLEQIDSRLARGGIEATLPGGEKRRLGFREKGPKAVVRLS